MKEAPSAPAHDPPEFSCSPSPLCTGPLALASDVNCPCSWQSHNQRVRRSLGASISIFRSSALRRDRPTQIPQSTHPMLTALRP